MKIQGPGKTEGTSKSKKKDNVSGSGEFGKFMTGGPASAAPAKSSQSIAQLDALLAVQGAEDPTERAAKKRMRQRSTVILDELDKIRMAMLTGTLTVGHMVDVADVVASHREKIMDPAMTAIMDEIDLRAQVEMAKMRVAMGIKDPADNSAA